MQALPMNRLIPLAFALLAAPAAAQPTPNSAPRLSLAQEAALRCSATFAKVASDQVRKVPGWERYPALATRGREFFVRALAQLMDETALDREGIAALAAAEARALQDKDELAKVMPSCLLILEGSGV